jgi:hypothetical protein
MIKKALVGAISVAGAFTNSYAPTITPSLNHRDSILLIRPGVSDSLVSAATSKHTLLRSSP